MAPSSKEDSADSQSPVGGKSLSVILGMAGFICMPSAVRDRITHTIESHNQTAQGGLGAGLRMDGNQGVAPPPRSLSLSLVFGSFPGVCLPHFIRGVSPPYGISMSDANSYPYWLRPENKGGSS